MIAEGDDKRAVIETYSGPKVAATYPSSPQSRGPTLATNGHNAAKPNHLVCEWWSHSDFSVCSHMLRDINRQLKTYSYPLSVCLSVFLYVCLSHGGADHLLFLPQTHLTVPSSHSNIYLLSCSASFHMVSQFNFWLAWLLYTWFLQETVQQRWCHIKHTGIIICGTLQQQ